MDYRQFRSELDEAGRKLALADTLLELQRLDGPTSTRYENPLSLVKEVDSTFKRLEMAAKLEPLTLPALAESWPADVDFKPLGKLSPATLRNIEPVGGHFLAEARRKRHKRTFSEDERIQAQERVKKTEDEDEGEISEPEDLHMLQRDPKDWKVSDDPDYDFEIDLKEIPDLDLDAFLRSLGFEPQLEGFEPELESFAPDILTEMQAQDHYAVLGLSKYRYKATDEQIKKANRKKVLKHHPDKRAAQGGTEDDRFFKCIQKATDTLLDPVKRRQFDSVDEEANVDVPSKKETKQGDFFKLWRPVFDSEARFSRMRPVPRLGDDNSTKKEVEDFYNFWYNFDSWRSFEYQDEDVPDDSADRDQKRHIERKNLNARKKKKTEDTARLRKLVDDALSLDHRIAKFRKEERAQKNKKKDEREAEAKKAAEEAKKKKEEDEKLKKEKEAAEKAEREEGKKAKEAAKSAVKKNKRVVRGAVKDANYFHANDDAPESQITKALNDVDTLLTKLDPDELATLSAALASEKDGPKIHEAYSASVSRLQDAGKVKEGDLKSLRV